jgi:hypothetical protein
MYKRYGKREVNQNAARSVMNQPLPEGGGALYIRRGVFALRTASFLSRWVILKPILPSLHNSVKYFAEKLGLFRCFSRSFFVCPLIVGYNGPLIAPAGGENPTGFHPFANSPPILAEELAAGRQNTAMRRLCFPYGCAMPPHGGILPAGNDAG